MSAYQIRILDEGCRVQSVETGMFVTQPLPFAVASRKAAALNSPRPLDEWPFLAHRTMAEVIRDEAVPTLRADLLGFSGCIEATTPIRGTRWTDWRRLLNAAAGVLILAGFTYLALVFT